MCPNLLKHLELKNPFIDIIHNFIPHEASICDDRDPPWINKDKKQTLRRIWLLHCSAA